MNEYIENLAPKAAFKLGLISGFGIIFIIGFFVLLGILVTADSKNSTSFNKQVNNKQPSLEVEQPSVQPSNNNQINIEPVGDSDWIKGNRDARLAVIEFSDTECPFCKRFHGTMNQIMDEYSPDQVVWAYRHFPLTQLHSKAAKEAEATECAGELGGNDVFWAYTDRLFEITPANNGLDLDQLPEIAEYVGLNRQAFETCLDSGRYSSKVNEQVNEAIAAGGQGTPYSVILTSDGQKVPIPGALPYEQIKSVIDSLLK